MRSVHGHGNTSAAVLIDGRVLDKHERLANDCEFTANKTSSLAMIFGTNFLQQLHAEIRILMERNEKRDGNSSCVHGTRMPPIWRYFIASKAGGGGKMVSV